MTGSSLLSNQSRTKLAPMNPAPPVTIINVISKWRGRSRAFFSSAAFYHAYLCRFAFAVVLAIPLHETGEPDTQRRRRRETGGGGESLDRRVRHGHVSRLQRLVFPDRAHAEQALQLADERLELDRGVIPDVVDRAWSDARCRRHRRPRQHAHDTLDNVVDVGKVALHLAIVENLDRLTLEHGSREQHRRHVRPSPGALNGEKTQAGRRHAVEMAVTVRHQLVGFFRRGGEAYPMIDVLIFGGR